MAGLDNEYMGSCHIAKNTKVGFLEQEPQLTPGDQPVGMLSGGEKRRMALCRLLLQNPDVLLLDEPSNDLDVATLRSLEEGLMNFGGCAVVISHDRWFLDRVATHIMAFEGDSEIIWFEGNYQTFHEWQHKEKGNNWTPH